jgi:hypothetical protein
VRALADGTALNIVVRRGSGAGLEASGTAAGT